MFGSSDGWASIGRASTRTESDDSLRARLHYVAGGTKGHKYEEPYIGARIAAAHGEELDRIADEHGLKRRTEKT